MNASDPPTLQGRFPCPGPTRAVVALHDAAQRDPVPGGAWPSSGTTTSRPRLPLDVGSRYWTKSHVNLWRGQGTGNLRHALAMARDWVMLSWLDGIRRTKAAPNENFAREFWELFTLGVDNGYTQADIVEAAKAFTGYRSA